jgi:hypothetical protein
MRIKAEEPLSFIARDDNDDINRQISLATLLAIFFSRLSLGVIIAYDRMHFLRVAFNYFEGLEE